jgi:hypothetical protein
MARKRKRGARHSAKRFPGFLLFGQVGNFKRKATANVHEKGRKEERQKEVPEEVTSANRRAKSTWQ